jgi:CRP/FNR family transcriptional regulator, cyclic AMP receptor protein
MGVGAGRHDRRASQRACGDRSVGGVCGRRERADGGDGEEHERCALRHLVLQLNCHLDPPWEWVQDEIEPRNRPVCCRWRRRRCLCVGGDVRFCGMQWRLLEGLADADVQRIVAVARRRRFGRHEVVFHRDDPGDSLHLVVKGRFAVRIMTPLGDTVTVAVRGPGESFGEMALVGEAPRRTATVAALEQAETLALYKDDFEELRRQHGSVDQLLFAFLVAEVRMLNERLLEALYLPVERRLLRRLRELTAAGESDGPLEVPLTQEELAELAGTTRATVNRILREEEKRGALRLERGRTIVLDRAEIARRAR